MFGIGSMEFLVIILVAVLVLGPDQLPKLIRTFTKVMGDVRRVSTDFQRTINLEINQEEYRQRQKEEKAKKRREVEARKAEAAKTAAEAATPETSETAEATPASPSSGEGDKA
jgi:sec-independent protein translocase protein TatB